MKTLAPLLALAVAVSVNAGTINLPTKYVETTWMVHTLTGTKSNERTRDKNVMSPLEVTKAEDKLKLTAHGKQGNDVSEDETVTIDFGQREPIVAALRNVAKLLRDQQPPKEAKESTLFTTGADTAVVSLVHIVKEKQKPLVEFNVGTRTYLLRNPLDVEKLTALFLAIK